MITGKRFLFIVINVVSGEKNTRMLLRELFDNRLLRALQTLGRVVAAESGEKLQQPFRAVRYRSETEWLDDAFCRSSGNWSQELLFGS